MSIASYLPAPITFSLLCLNCVIRRHSREECCCLKCDVLLSGRNSQTFRRNLLPPTSEKKNLLLLANIYQTTRHHSSEDDIHHSHRLKKLKFHTVIRTSCWLLNVASLNAAARFKQVFSCHSMMLITIPRQYELFLWHSQYASLNALHRSGC